MPDGLETLGNAGVRAVIHPGGSKNDPKVTEAADALGMAVVLDRGTPLPALSRGLRRSAPSRESATLSPTG